MKQFLLSSWRNVDRTLAMAVGSPSIDRRGIMLKLISVLVLIFTFGIGQMWGANQTVTWTATSGALGTATVTTSTNATGSISTGSFSWNYTRSYASRKDNTKTDHVSWQSTNGYIQLGSSNFQEDVSFTTSAIKGTIKSISVNCASASGGHKLTIDVGGTKYLNAVNTPSWSSNNGSTQTGPSSGTGSSSGAITISFKAGSGAVYIKSISVTYEPSANPVDPTITPTNGEVEVGHNLDVSTLFESNSSGAITYSITAGSSYASLSGSTLTGTAVGSVTIQASQAAATGFNAKTATCTVNVTPELSTITITQNDIANFTSSYAEYDWTADDISGKIYAYKNNGMQLNSGQSGYYVYNTDPIPGKIRKITMTKASGTTRTWTPYVSTSALTSTSGGTALTAKNVESTTTWDVTGDNTYFYLTLTGGATVIGSIVISYEACDALAQIKGSVNLSSPTAQRSITVNWANETTAGDVDHYELSYKVKGAEGDPTVINNIANNVNTYTVTGLACSTTYQFTLTAVGNSTHCDYTSDVLEGTTASAMTLPALGYTSTSLTVGGSTASPSWATTPTHDGAVTYVSNNTSVVTVNPSTGVITPVGAGSTTITATYAQTANNCEASQTSSTITVTGNVSVSFNANGGSGTMTNQSIQVSTPTNLTTNAFSAPNSCKYFYGWATSKANADAETRAYEDEESVTITAGMELFAIWKTYNYTVTKGTGTGASTFTLSANNADCGGSITVTATPDGTHKGDPQVSITPSNAATVSGTTISNITAAITAVDVEFAAKENYTIEWYVNGEKLTTGGMTTNVLEGAGIANLPADPAGLDCAATFVGWSTDEIGLTPLDKDDETDATRIAALGLFKDAAHAPAIDGNKIFHAVFATGSGSENYEYVLTPAASLTAGEYVIAAYDGTNSKYLAATGSITSPSSGKYDLENETTGFTISDGKFTSLPTGACLFVLTAYTGENENGFYIQNPLDNKYLDYSDASNNRTFEYYAASEYLDNEVPTTPWAAWYGVALSKEGLPSDGMYLKYVDGSYSIFVNGSSTSLIRGYKSDDSKYNPVYLFKKTGGLTYNNYVTKCCKTWSDPIVTYNSYALVAGESHATITITGDQKGLTPTYASSNTNVLTVDENGEVTPVGAGKATVTVTWAAANDYCEKVITSSEFTVTGVAVITFKLNGGSVAGDAEKTQNVTTGVDATLTSLAMLGYVAPSCKQFGGWAASQEDANAATPVVFKADGATINVDAATNLWAIWNTIQYDVTKGSNSGAATFTLPPKVDCGGTISITCEADATHKGNPTISATEGKYTNINVLSATSAEITGVSGDIEVSISYDAKASYAITWNVNGVAYAPHDADPEKVNGTTTLYEGGTLVLPTAPADNTLACKNKFMGWSKKDAGSVAKTTAYYDDLFTDATDAPEIEAATDFYAVFATQTGSSAFDGSAGGNYRIYALVGSTKYYATSTLSSGKLSTTTNASDAAVFTFTKKSDSENQFSIKVGDTYYGHSGSNTNITNPENEYFWTVSSVSSNGSWRLESTTSGRGFIYQDYTTSGQTKTYTRKFGGYTTSNVDGDDYFDVEIEAVSSATNYVTQCAAVEAPTFSVAAGTYNEAQSVTLSSATDGADIYYTTNGSTPTSGSTAYSGAIAVNQNMTIKAIAIKGSDESDVAEAAYVLKVATPEISGATAFVNSSTVTITATGADAIYYTTNGSDPTTESTPYTAPFEVNATTTVKAIAVKSNWTSSEIASQTFTKITPLDVATAITNISALDNNGTIANQFVKGIISQIDQYNSGDNTITYWISDNGTTTSQMEVYHGSAGVANGGNAFSAADNLKVGEEVIVSGTLKKFVSGNKTTPEFVNPNEIVAYKTHSPIAWSAGACTAELNGEENEYPTLNNAAGLSISYESTTPATATIDENGEVTPVAVGSTTIKATSAANSSYVATTVSYTLTVSPTVTRVDLDIECNGATSGCPETTHLVKQTNLPDPLPAVAKAGKNFGGWYTDNTFETPAVAGASITENTTIYAQWLEPYTVAEALTIISGLGANNANTISTEYYYVAGVVTDDAVDVSSNTATYKVKDPGESNELKVYKGKGLDNVNITEASQIQEADEVVVYGLLQNYYGTAQIAQGNYIYSLDRPTFDVESVSLPSTANVRAGKTVTLTAEITPSNASDKAVTWESDDEEVATVDEDGVVTGVAEGTATITVTTHDGGHTAQCTVTVAAGLPTFTEDDHEWIKVSNASKLVAGRFYVIAESASGKTATTSISSSVMGHVTSTFSSDKSVIASGDLGDNTAIFELGGNSTDGWTLYELTDEENTGYLSGTNTSSLSWSASAATTSISFDESGNAILGNANGYRVLYNSSSPRFKGYDSNTSASMLLPQLYMWAELSHSVTFDANGGVAESVPSVERTDEGKITIPATEPTHSDVAKAFAGWYEESAPSVLYTAGDEFATNVDVTLYAKWNTVPTYTVTYVPGGTGTGIPVVASYPAGRKVLVATVDDLSNPGYLFTGWVVKDADQNVLDIDEENKFEMPASNVTITAGWSRESSQKWALVKHGETLDKNEEYIIACTFTPKNADPKTVALGDIVTISSNKVGQSVDVRRSGDIVKGSEAMVAYTLVTGNGGSNYAFQNGSNYLTWSSGNTLDKSATLNDASSWTIEIDEENNAVIKNVGTDNRQMFYNSANPRFACYTSTQTKIQLYRKVLSAVVTAADATDASIPTNADITVKEGGVLTIGNDKTIGDLNIEAGGKVVVDENKLTVVGTFSIETTMASGKSGQLSGATASNFEAQQEAYIDITLGAGGTNQQWHAFTVPFPVDVMNGVYDLAGNKLQNEVNYAIMEYLGDVRATGAYGWKKIRTTLVPGTFYIMATDGYRTTYRFKKKAGEALVATNSKAYYKYESSTGNNDNGWNGIGNPNLFYGKVDLAVQVLDPASYTYITKTANSTNFVVGTPFFYQADGNGTMVMATANAGANYAPARVQTTEIKDMPVSFGNEDFTDYLYVSANEDALNEYETGKDLAKMTMTNTPKVAQIFGSAYNTKLCMVNTPLVNNQAEVALELYAPQAGEYTISTPAMEGVTVYLTREGSIIWNLSMGEYKAEFAKGNNAGYGIRLVKAPKVATDLDNIYDNESGAQKVIIDNKVFILRGGQMYDATGRLAK